MDVLRTLCSCIYLTSTERTACSRLTAHGCCPPLRTFLPSFLPPSQVLRTLSSEQVWGGDVGALDSSWVPGPEQPQGGGAEGWSPGF